VQNIIRADGVPRLRFDQEDVQKSKVRFADHPPGTPQGFLFGRSMSSIKKDVKKKASPSTARREDFCLESSG
jgi:hypothetical protein